MRAHTLLATASGLLVSLSGPSVAQTLYEFGNPSAEEQQYIEFINRARANPPAEGTRLAATTDPAVTSAMASFSVDLGLMQTEFDAINAQPPLAPHAALMVAARGHSQWMFNNQVQSHDQTNPTKTLATRLSEAGYPYYTAGENIFAYSKSPWYGHAGFQVDWGTGGTGGMQDGRGHRMNIHSGNFREIGVGMVLGTNGMVGPEVVTQDFGTRLSMNPLGTGVAYYDLNGNNFYDVGEGIAGLTVNVSGAADYCQTAIGGGWVVPVPATTASRTLSFTGLNVSQSFNLSFSGSVNTKADLKLAYTPPAITSTPTATAGTPHTVTFHPVGGATSYTWSRWTKAAAAAENCENTTGVTVSKTGSYSIVSTTIKQQGTASFHLENSTGSSQWIELNAVYHGGTSPSLTYQNRLRYAMATEQLKVQVREEASSTWVDVDSQNGTGTDRDSVFSQRNVSLAAMAGKAFKLRFILNFSGGSYFTTSGDHMGWYVDAISFSDVSTLGNRVDEVLAGTSGSFTPAQGSYVMAVTPTISNRAFPAATQTLNVAAGVATPPVITGQPASSSIASGTTATLTVAADGGSLSYQWYQGTSGNTSTPVGTNSASFTSHSLTSTTSFWVRVSNSEGTADSATATISVLTPTSIVQQPASTTIASGSTATFSVTASGSSPAYQWYVGNPGVTTNPVAGANGPVFTTPALTSTTSYWVRVSNAVGSANSNQATATVVSPPVITSHPAPTAVPSGGTTTLSVAATGGNLSYQWYAGASGSTVQPVSGATASTFTTPPLTGPASYWVRVGNIAGSADSNAALISISTPPVILAQPVSPVIQKNTSATLFVIASGPGLTYQWYQGDSGVTSSPVSGAINSSFTTPTIPNPRKYWVRVTNSSGSLNSVTASISTQNGAVTRSYSTWASEIEIANGLASGSISNGNGDPDRDGRTNLVEYAFGCSPVVPNDASPRLPVIQPSATHFVLRYQKNTALTDITLVPEAGTLAGSWGTPGQPGAPAGFTDTLISTSGGIETRETTLPRSSGARGFLRMKVSRP